VIAARRDLGEDLPPVTMTGLACPVSSVAELAAEIVAPAPDQSAHREAAGVAVTCDDLGEDRYLTPRPEPNRSIGTPRPSWPALLSPQQRVTSCRGRWRSRACPRRRR
jgi:hypothetical protein